jgi:hypothetical protein
MEHYSVRRRRGLAGTVRHRQKPLVLTVDMFDKSGPYRRFGWLDASKRTELAQFRDGRTAPTTSIALNQ